MASANRFNLLTKKEETDQNDCKVEHYLQQADEKAQERLLR
jgi:hypothetical protein